MYRVSSITSKTSLLVGCVLLAGCTSAMSNRLNDSDKLADTGIRDNALAFQSDAEFGRDLSKKQRGALSAAELQALEFGKPGQPVEWGDEKGRVTGSVVVTQPFRVGQSSCRRFTHLLTQKSKSQQSTSQQANGTACRREGGAWRLVQ